MRCSGSDWWRTMLPSVIAERWQNTSSPPWSGMMNPNPREFQRPATPVLRPPPLEDDNPYLPRAGERERLRSRRAPGERERLRSRRAPGERERLRSRRAPGEGLRERAAPPLRLLAPFAGGAGLQSGLAIVLDAPENLETRTTRLSAKL